MPKYWEIQGYTYEIRKIVQITETNVTVLTPDNAYTFAATELAPRVLQAFQQAGHFLDVRPGGAPSVAPVASLTGKNQPSEPTVPAQTRVSTPASGPPVTPLPTSLPAANPGRSEAQLETTANLSEGQVSYDVTVEEEEARPSFSHMNLAVFTVGCLIVLGSGIWYSWIFISLHGWGVFFLTFIPVVGGFIAIYYFFKSTQELLPALGLNLLGVAICWVGIAMV